MSHITLLYPERGVDEVRNAIKISRVGASSETSAVVL